MPISKAFAQIEQQPNIYDVVHVKYFDEVWTMRLMIDGFCHLVSKEFLVQLAFVLY